MKRTNTKRSERPIFAPLTAQDLILIALTIAGGWGGIYLFAGWILQAWNLVHGGTN